MLTGMFGICYSYINQIKMKNEQWEACIRIWPWCKLHFAMISYLNKCAKQCYYDGMQLEINYHVQNNNSAFAIRLDVDLYILEAS